MMRSCAICGAVGHNRRDHDAAAQSRSLAAGRLVYEEGLSFAAAGRRLGITRQAAHQGWRCYVRKRDLHNT